jgi:hypothetical protein
MPTQIAVSKTVDYKNVKLAMKILADNGIEPDECGTVLQAVGYALLDAELGPLIKDAEEK